MIPTKTTLRIDQTQSGPIAYPPGTYVRIEISHVTFEENSEMARLQREIGRIIGLTMDQTSYFIQYNSRQDPYRCPRQYVVPA